MCVYNIHLHFVWQKSPGGDFFSKFAFAGVLIDEVRTSKEVGRVQQAQPTVKVEKFSWWKPVLASVL